MNADKIRELHFIEYLKLVAILVVPMLYISVYSFSKEEIEWSITLQKVNIADKFVEKDSDLLQDTVILETKNTVVNDTTSQRILFIGDSMLEGLCNRLKLYARENDHELLNVIWYSSGTKVWGTHTDTLAYFMRSFNPTYILICLGSNELFVSNPDKYEIYIKQILTQIGDIPYVWIGPPNWKDDTGINEVIAKAVTQNSFFPSKRLKYERASDGAHPTKSSAAKWMDSVAAFITDSVNYRISMRYPQEDAKPKGTTIVLQPLKK